MGGVSVHELAVPGCPEARGIGPAATKKQSALRREDTQICVGGRNHREEGATDKVLLPADTTALLKLKYWSQSVDVSLREMG